MVISDNTESFISDNFSRLKLMVKTGLVKNMPTSGSTDSVVSLIKSNLKLRKSLTGVKNHTRLGINP